MASKWEFAKNRGPVLGGTYDNDYLCYFGVISGPVVLEAHLHMVYLKFYVRRRHIPSDVVGYLASSGHSTTQPELMGRRLSGLQTAWDLLLRTILRSCSGGL